MRKGRIKVLSNEYVIACRIKINKTKYFVGY